MKIRFILSLSFAWLLALTLSEAHATVIIGWTFQEESLPSNYSAVPSVNLTSGGFSLIGGTTSTNNAGHANSAAATEGLIGAGNAGRALQLADFPAQSTGSGTAGVQFNLSTLGYGNIQLSFDAFRNDGLSRYFALQYTADVTSDSPVWTTYGGVIDWAYSENPENRWVPSPFVFDLSSISAANNNALFALRLVAVFSPYEFTDTAGTHAANTAYQRARQWSGGNYAPGSTLRLDNFYITGTVIPEPSTATLLLLLAGVGVICQFNRKKLMPLH